jgi:hypothetical protein
VGGVADVMCADDEYGLLEAGAERGEEGREDRYFLAAEDAIRALIDQDRAKVYYLKQLEVLLEKQFFH